MRNKQSVILRLSDIVTSRTLLALWQGCYMPISIFLKKEDTDSSIQEFSYVPEISEEVHRLLYPNPWGVLRTTSTAFHVALFYFLHFIFSSFYWLSYSCFPWALSSCLFVLFYTILFSFFGCAGGSVIQYLCCFCFILLWFEFLNFWDFCLQFSYCLYYLCLLFFVPSGMLDSSIKYLAICSYAFMLN